MVCSPVRAPMVARHRSQIVPERDGNAELLRSGGERAQTGISREAVVGSGRRRNDSRDFRCRARRSTLWRFTVLAAAHATRCTLRPFGVRTNRVERDGCGRPCASRFPRCCWDRTLLSSSLWLAASPPSRFPSRLASSANRLATARARRFLCRYELPSRRQCAR